MINFLNDMVMEGKAEEEEKEKKREGKAAALKE